MLSHTLGQVTYPSFAPVVPRPREGHRRRFDEADKRRILEAAAQRGASVLEVARRYGIDRRVLCRWKQELMPPVFDWLRASRGPRHDLLPQNVKVHLTLGYIDMRKGIDGLAMPCSSRL